MGGVSGLVAERYCRGDALSGFVSRLSRTGSRRSVHCPRAAIGSSKLSCGVWEALTRREWYAGEHLERGE
jgi:hypothetical protein